MIALCKLCDIEERGRTRRIVKRNTVIVIAAVFLPTCFCGPFPATRNWRTPSSNAPVAERAAEKKILAVLDRMVKSHETYLSVPSKTGRRCSFSPRPGTQERGRVGTSTGYSGLWLSGSTETNGRLTTFEIDHREIYGSSHFQGKLCGEDVTIIEAMLTSSGEGERAIDLAFIDADKRASRLSEQALPLVQPGG